MVGDWNTKQDGACVSWVTMSALIRPMNSGVHRRLIINTSLPGTVYDMNHFLGIFLFCSDL